MAWWFCDLYATITCVVRDCRFAPRIPVSLCTFLEHSSFLCRLGKEPYDYPPLLYYRLISEIIPYHGQSVSATSHLPQPPLRHPHP